MDNTSDSNENETSEDENMKNEKLDETHFLDKRNHKKNSVWEYFEILNNKKKVAECNLCQKPLSYKTSSTNLKKHLKLKHYIDLGLDIVEDTEKLDVNKDRKRRSYTSVAWQHFKVKDRERKLAICNYCDMQMSYYASVTNLMHHVRRKHADEAKLIEDIVQSDNNVSYVDEKSQNNKYRSSVWLYFKCLDEFNKISMCLICKKRLRHLSSLSNLKKHLSRKHPNVNISDTQEVLIASDGQLYEIDDSKEDHLNDDESKVIEMDTVYLEDFEDDDIPLQTKKLQNKPTKTGKKRKKSFTLNDVNTADSDSSDDNVTFQKKYVSKKTDTLDQFGKYLISLLKQLPKELSNQLQMDFVKQAITAQLTYESEKKSKVTVTDNGYSITITEPQEQRTSDGDL